MLCSECSKEEKKIFGCEQPSQVAVWGIEDIMFYSCPLLFLNEEIVNWYQEYKMLKEGIVLPDKFLEKQAKWYEAVSVYSLYFQKFEGLKNKNKNSNISKKPKRNHG